MTISAGTLQLGDGSAHNGSLAGSIVDNSAVVFDNFSNQTVTNAISGNGSLTAEGSPNLTLTGNNSYSGSTSVTAGNLIVDGTGGNQALGGTSNLLVGNGTRCSSSPAGRSTTPRRSAWPYGYAVGQRRPERRHR